MSISKDDAINDFSTPQYHTMRGVYPIMFWFNFNICWIANNGNGKGKFYKLKEVDNSLYINMENGDLSLCSADVQAKWSISNVDGIILGDDNEQ